MNLKYGSFPILLDFEDLNFCIIICILSSNREKEVNVSSPCELRTAVMIVCMKIFVVV